MAASLKAGSRPPWVGLGAAVWVQIAAGNAYNFPLYSHSLKSVLGFNQQQLTMLGVANDIGENFGLLPGVFCNKLPPWVVLLIGALACFLGYGVLWLAISQTVQSLPYWLVNIAIPLIIVNIHIDGCSGCQFRSIRSMSRIINSEIWRTCKVLKKVQVVMYVP